MEGEKNRVVMVGGLLRSEIIQVVRYPKLIFLSLPETCVATVEEKLLQWMWSGVPLL